MPIVGRVFGGLDFSNYFIVLSTKVGRILRALKDQGLDNNTLVIFTSDNGGANYIGLPDINQPFRGWKMTFFEGGVHMPFFARWPTWSSRSYFTLNSPYSCPGRRPSLHWQERPAQRVP